MNVIARQPQLIVSDAEQAWRHTFGTLPQVQREQFTATGSNASLCFASETLSPRVAICCRELVHSASYSLGHDSSGRGIIGEASADWIISLEALRTRFLLSSQRTSDGGLRYCSYPRL